MSIPERLPDRVYDALDVVGHFVVPKAERSITAPVQASSADFVCVAAFIVLTSVELDDETRLRADEIHDRVSDHFLAQKPVSFETLHPQPIPEQTFGAGRVVAHVTRNVSELVFRTFSLFHGRDDT